MTIKEFIEENKGKYTDICCETQDKAQGFLSPGDLYPDMTKEQRDALLKKDIASCNVVEMNGCEFYLWIHDPNENAWQFYEDYGEESKESIRKKELNDYTENDKFLVIFA